METEFILARSSGDPVFAIVLFGGFFAWGVGWLVYNLSTYIVATMVTPKKHARIRNLKSTEAYRSLHTDGYAVTPDWRTDAIERLKKSRN
jgi:hypothetical protein